MTEFLKAKRQWTAENWKALLAVFVIGLIPFLLPTDSEGPFLFSPGKALFASDQLAAPSWRFYLESIKHGVIPQWQTNNLGGMPTFDAGFGDGAYPLFLFIGMIMPIKTFISWCFVFHVLLAGKGAYYLVRRYFGLDKILSVALASAYMLNTNFISHIHAGHTGKFYIMAWLPICLYLLLRCLSKAARWYHALGFALSLSLILSTFHPQFAYYMLMGFFLVWAFQTFWLLKEKQYPRAALTAARFWAPVLLGIGMVFFLFYPPMQWTKQFGVRGSGEKTTYEHATSWSMHPEETASLLVPEFGGLNEKYWGRNPFKLNSEYPGLSVLFLGALGLALFRKEKRKWFWLWGGVGLLSVIFGLGAHTPVFRLFYSFIPGIKTFRAPSMMLFWLATALLIMSADTLSRLTQTTTVGGRKPIPPDVRKAWSKRLLRVGLAAAGLLIVAGLVPGAVFTVWDIVFSSEVASNVANRSAAQGAFALGAIRSGLLLGVLVLATRKWLLEEVEPLRFGLVLLAVTCVDLVWVDSNFIRTYDPERFLAPQQAVNYLKADTSTYRVFGLPGAYDSWVMHFHDIETVDGWTDNEYVVYRNYRGKDYQSNPNFMAGLKQNADGSVSGSPFLDMLNVKYLAFKQPGDGVLRLVPNASVLPRAWFVSAWDTLPDSLALERMKQPDFNPRRLAWISTPGVSPLLPAAPAVAADTARSGNTAATSGPTSGTPSATAPTAAASATAAGISGTETAAVIRRDGNGYNSSDWTVTAPSRGIFILSELWFPHWQVKVDGKPAALLRTDYAFRGVQLEPGTHHVNYSYYSPWRALGFKVAIFSCLALIAFVAGLKVLAAKLPAGEAPGGEAQGGGTKRA